MLTRSSSLSSSPTVAEAIPIWVVVGRESVGKSQLVSSLTGRSAGETNFRGSTVAVHRYAGPQREFIDTPGILRKSDTDTTRRALAALEGSDSLLLVVQATQLDDDLADMLPLVEGRAGCVVVTFWDKVQQGEAAQEALERLSADAGVPFVAVNARRLTATDRERIERHLARPGVFRRAALTTKAGWRVEPKPGLLEHRWFGPVAAIALLVLPALATIYGANVLANVLHPIVQTWVDPSIAVVNASWPAWLKIVLTAQHGDFGYGLLNMGPFLLVWALPTVLLFAAILGAYKASGLVERINVALHPLVRPLGLSGRDIVRVMMGFGCNVPAVISTRACSGCSRCQAIAAISFGSACSYQLPATLAVLSAVATAHGQSAMVLSFAFLGYLLITTLIYLRLTASQESRSPLNILLSPRRPFMQWPTLPALRREMSGTVKQFLLQAMPVFVVICVVASGLAWCGVLDWCANTCSPLMAAFDLPRDAALPVILSAVRKDAIFLFAADEGLAFPMTTVQVLTAVYLAGVLLPCLVTAMTIRREVGWKPAARMLTRQAVFAVAFSLILAWSGRWLM